jgi:hypothetical protein
MEPRREDGRRCLSVREIESLGWQQNPQGRWFDPVKTERAREAFGRAGADNADSQQMPLARAAQRLRGAENRTPERVGAVPAAVS